MKDLKDKWYEQIEHSLSFIAISIRNLILKCGENEETVDRFISEVGSREIDRTRNMNEIEILFEMLKSINDHMDRSKEVTE